MEDFILGKVVQLSLTAYLEWVVTPWLLKQCTKKDDLQENTGLGSGEMSKTQPAYDFRTAINLVTNMDDLAPHLLYKRLWKMLESIVSEYILKHQLISVLHVHIAVGHTLIEIKDHTGTVVYIRILFWNMIGLNRQKWKAKENSGELHL